ncbi:hydroxymethylbilane synthase [candidate division CSSED10-310 bacterium]|uniref:Porphobilinogen deaminase n=1 Tax=candidate division CSSED10-310 bacterium TaxID=2855610 RepID=A0ABV6YVC1_UNCC1
MSIRLTLGTRGSKLALWQANWVRDNLSSMFPGSEIMIKIVKTKGDKVLDCPLSQIGSRGVFVKELEEAILRNEVDVAIHSAKDIPSELPADLSLLAFSPREDPRDVLVSKKGLPLEKLPDRAIIGTSSLRRICQLKLLRPDINFVDLRGNLDTRLAKLHQGNMDAITVAAAGIIRLGFTEQVTEFFRPDVVIPAVGQGAIAIEGKESRPDLRQIFARITDEESTIRVTAERSFLSRLEAGCQVPIAAHAILTNQSLSLHALMSNLSGTKVIMDSMTAPSHQAARLGLSLAEKLLTAGGDEILQEIRDSARENLF